jgi:hypothetical protein
MAEPQYEFNEAQEEIFLELSEKISIVSTFFIMIGLFRLSIGILVGIFAHDMGIGIGLDSIIDGAFYFFIGFLGKKVTKDFKKIVDTQGNDIDYLMSALNELRKGVGLAFWLLIFSAMVWVAVVIHGIINAAKDTQMW